MVVSSPNYYLEIVERLKESRDSGIDPVTRVPMSNEFSEAISLEFIEFIAESHRCKTGTKSLRVKK